MSTLDRLRAIANRAGRPTMSYSYENEHREQRESLDWIAHEAAEAIKEITAAGRELNAIELGAAVRRLGLTGDVSEHTTGYFPALAGSGGAPPICTKHGKQMILGFHDRPGSAPGNAWMCLTCAEERTQ